MNQQRLTKQESVSYTPVGMSFNAFISKEMLLQIMPELSNGNRIHFGENNG